MARLLLLLPTSTYRAPDFLEAARRIGVEITVASEEKNVLESRNPAGYLKLDFEDVESSCRAMLEFSRRYPIDAVLGLDDATVVAAAAISRTLSLESNSVESVEASRNKLLMRAHLRRAGVPIPEFFAFLLHEDPVFAASRVQYPCVLKPTMLSASQGVIRANGPGEFVRAWRRIARIVKKLRTAPDILAEAFVPGPEVAVEGLLEKGRLMVLAIFDKPDPLDGPFFEETIYVRPSRLPRKVQDSVVSCVAMATKALGLIKGPVHAEVRISKKGPCIIEVAARPIGGRCSRALRSGLGISLEELILRQALGFDFPRAKAPWVDPTPSGVMMIPIPKAGILRGISGKDRARQVPGIEDILLSAHRGQTIVPLPEGSRYVGFIIARATTPESVDMALRQAHQCLQFDIEPLPTDSSVPILSGCGESR